MKIVETHPPSFPQATLNQLLTVQVQKRWQVLCGDNDHWRVGIYSPAETSLDEIHELERHDCPELFLLLQGEITLVLCTQGKLEKIPLKPLQPVLVTAPHNGFCPQGAHSGMAIVVERDRFVTEYQPVSDWLRAQS